MVAQCFMSRVNKKIAALAVLFSLEFLSLGLFTNGIFSWTNQHVPPLLKGASDINVTAAKFDSLVKADSRFALKASDELTPRPESFLTAKENAGFSRRSFRIVPFRFMIILAPKVSRYISKSVFNL
jgi:hypothetical protein